MDVILDWIMNSSKVSQWLFWDMESKIPLRKVEPSTLMERLMMEQEVFKTFISWNPLDWFYKYIKKKTILSNIKDKNDAGNFEIVWYIKDIRRAKKKWFFITIEDISDSFDIFLTDTYWYQKFDLVIVSWWKKNRFQVTKIVKTSREKLKELSWTSYDEKETVFEVKKARAGEQQQLNIERIKAEIAAENAKKEESETNEKKVEKQTFTEENEIEDNSDIDETFEENFQWEIEEIIEDTETEENMSDDENLDSGMDTSEIENLESDNQDIKENIENSSWDTEMTEKQENNIEEKTELDSENVGKLVITPENLSFSKMKTLMTIISWNPWEIEIEVLWNEMKVSEKWLDELKKLIQE